MRLLDPRSSIALILGASDWSKAELPSAPSFRRSATHLDRYLVSRVPDGIGLQPERVLDLFDDPSPSSAQLIRIRQTLSSLVHEKRDTEFPVRDLLIYYIGHGTAEAGRHLHFLVRDSVAGIEEQSSISVSDLAKVLWIAAPRQRRLAIVDCCFSEAAVDAFGQMGAALDEAVADTVMKDLSPKSPPPERGTLLLCSSPRKRPSVGLPNAEYTLFTGALLTVLEKGVRSHESTMFSFSELRDQIFDRMIIDYQGTPPRPASHQPDQQTGDLTLIPAFPNPAASVSRVGTFIVNGTVEDAKIVPAKRTELDGRVTHKELGSPDTWGIAEESAEAARRKADEKRIAADEVAAQSSATAPKPGKKSHANKALGIVVTILLIPLANLPCFFLGRFLASFSLPIPSDETLMPWIIWALTPVLSGGGGSFCGLFLALLGALLKAFDDGIQKAYLMGTFLTCWLGFLVGFRFVNGLPQNDQPSVWLAIPCVIFFWMGLIGGVSILSSGKTE